MSSTLNTFVPVLDGTNYQQWAAAMQSYLMSQGQWRVIIRNPPIPKFADSVPVEQITDAEGKLDVRRTQRAQEVADRAAQLTGPTNQDAIDEWDEAISKAIGNIRLRLHHTIGYQYNNVTSASALWHQLNEEYGRPGISQAFTEFKGTMNTTIPSNSDPSPSLDKMKAHFTRLRESGFEIPEKIQAMMILCKAPAQMETVVQLCFQEGDYDEMKVDKITASFRTAWEASQRQGNRPQQNQQRANKLSAVKRDAGPPQFIQQQQQPQQQRGDGTWQQQQVRRKRGKRGGVKNTQQQLQAAAQELPPQPQ